jgi:L,D-transpeptidase ErfK/SrfK
LKKRIILFLPILLLLSFLSSNIRADQGDQKLPDYLPMVGNDTSYQVSAGEGLYQIAKKFDLSYMSIATANQISNPNQIYGGQNLILPTRTILPKKLDQGIIINLPEFRLYLFQEDQKVQVYPICIGLPTWTTPIGEFTITHKLKNPTWYMPKSIAEKEKVKREIIPPGPLNPLGDFWIGTDLGSTGLHSTNQPMSIGRALSHGCVRLYPEDAEMLFEQMEVGMKGEIIYEPIKLTVSEDSFFLEVHPDPYGMVNDYEKEIIKKLKLLNLSTVLDQEKIKIVVQEKRGIPVFIGRLVE